MNKREGNATDLVLTKLRAAIQHGEFAPGQRLIEADLMRTFSVTRGPLREALRRLGIEGVIELTPNKGAMVKAYTQQELIDLFRIRESIEGLAARLAAENVLNRGLKEFFEQRYENIIHHETSESTSFGDENRAFHDLLVEIADNHQLADLMKRLQLPIVRYQIRAGLDEHYRNQSRQEHQSVVNAILNGDPELADLHMREHLRRASARIQAKKTPTY